MLTKIEYTNKMNEQIKSMLTNQKLIHKTFGEGTITNVDSIEFDELRNETHVRIDVQFNDVLKHLAYRNSLSSIMTIESVEIQEFLKSVDKEFQNYLVAEKAEQEKERKLKLEQEQIRLKEAAFQRKKERDLLKLTNYKLLPITSDRTANFYYTLGWIAKHVTRISAAMPDYEESWFRSKFNKFDTNDKSIRIVDSAYRSPAGWQEQWGLGMSIRFRLAKDETIPSLLAKYHFNSNTINNVDLVWNLIENYGFDFGSIQDLERIKASIPEAYTLDFEAALE